MHYISCIPASSEQQPGLYVHWTGITVLHCPLSGRVWNWEKLRNSLQRVPKWDTNRLCHKLWQVSQVILRRHLRCATKEQMITTSEAFHIGSCVWIRPFERKRVNIYTAMAEACRERLTRAKSEYMAENGRQWSSVIKKAKAVGGT
jgi:hypothetical protein